MFDRDMNGVLLVMLVVRVLGFAYLSMDSYWKSTWTARGMV